MIDDRPLPRPTIAFVMIELEAHTDDGPIRHRTWAVGETADAAMQRWAKRQPKLRDSVVSYETVTPDSNPMLPAWRDRVRLPAHRI